MTVLSLMRISVAVGGLTLSLTAGAGLASADPDLSPAVNTTCSYHQLAAALNAQDPTLAAVFNSSPEMQAGLRQFLAGSKSQRTQMAEQLVSDPDSQPYIGVLQQTFNTCNNY